MFRLLKFSFLGTISVYILIVIIGFFLRARLDIEFISRVGLGIGVFLIVVGLPLHRMLFFGGRSLNPNWPVLPRDDKFYNQVARDYESNTGGNNLANNILIISGVLSILIAICLFKLS